MNKIRDYILFFESKRKFVFIDEYGLHTTQGVTHGYCLDEETKTQILHDFIMWIYPKKIIWCYFSLFDTSEADWGLAYPNCTLKQSGKMVKNLLPKVTA